MNHDDLEVLKEKKKALRLAREIITRYVKDGKEKEAYEWERIINSLGVGIDRFSD